MWKTTTPKSFCSQPVETEPKETEFNTSVPPTSTCHPTTSPEPTGLSKEGPQSRTRLNTRSVVIPETDECSFTSEGFVHSVLLTDNWLSEKYWVGAFSVSEERLHQCSDQSKFPSLVSKVENHPHVFTLTSVSHSPGTPYCTLCKTLVETFCVRWCKRVNQCY